MYTLDTNAIIYYLKGDVKAVDQFRDVLSRDVPLYISAITEIELFGFPDISREEILKIENILSTLAIIPVDSRIARIAGELRRIYRLKTPDSAVAATAMFTGSTLITRNVHDFKKIPHLSLQEV